MKPDLTFRRSVRLILQRWWLVLLCGAGFAALAFGLTGFQKGHYTATNVLSVPVTALLATAGGGYAVQEAQARHRVIPVTAGLFAAGYVQISGPDAYPGLHVTDSQA